MKVDTTKNDIRKIVADLPMDKEISRKNANHYIL